MAVLIAALYGIGIGMCLFGGLYAMYLDAKPNHD